jgi:hypothetical protein
VNPLTPDLEPRLSTLQTEMERLRQVTSGAGSTEERLARLTEECADIIRRWGLTSERHARAVERFESHLNEWSEAGARLQQDASHRIQELERIIHQEWGELRHLHEEPIRQLAEHATSLTQVCIATANVAQQGFERSEARLAAIEGELNHRLTELTRELQAVVTELRATRTGAPRVAATAPWSLEGVTRLHDQLRGEGVAALAPATVAAPAHAPAPVAGLLPEAASVLTERIATLEQALERETTAREAADHSAPNTRIWRAVAAAMGVAILLALAVAWQLRGDVQEATARVEQAQREQQAASEDAARQVSAARADAERQVAEARARADRAQIVGNVLAAPDLVRYNLVGRAALIGASAQVHWSRSQGMVFSGSTIATPPADTTYQIWLLVRGGAVKAAPFVPDPSGTATVAITPPLMPRPAFGAIVTLEPKAGSDTPSGTALMVRAPVPQPPVPALP